MVLVFGTVAIDTTRTPFKVAERVMGGAASYTSLAASFFTKTSVVAAIGTDYPQKFLDILRGRVDVSGIRTLPGKSFFYDSSFDMDLGKRTPLATEVGVTAGYMPELPESLRKEKYVYMGNNDPSQIIRLLEQMDSPKLTVCDTIKYWIENTRPELERMFGMVDAIIVNDEEARQITNQVNLIKCARKLLGFGPKFAIIKKGEHGALLFKENGDFCFPAPAYPLEDIVDPTGAGDSFGGGFVGHIARRDSLADFTLKEAVVYGNVMGSFAVEDFSVDRFLKITTADIEARFEKYRKLVHF
ncbi:MAG: PfkB family carbohydrate kinase [Candidatus Aenigmatarchaeota archaeon]